jgi:hypothetical protein
MLALESAPPYAIWSIWKMLGFSSRLFFLVLCVAGIYVVCVSVLATMRVRTIAKALPVEDVASVSRSVAMLHKRSLRVRQLVGALFHLFGVVLFVALQRDFIVLGHSNIPTGLIIRDNFILDFAFAANVFFVFLIVHTTQWLAAEQVDSCTSRLSAQLEG